MRLSGGKLKESGGPQARDDYLNLESDSRYGTPSEVELVMGAGKRHVGSSKKSRLISEPGRGYWAPCLVAKRINLRISAAYLVDTLEP